jgi:hypothetical protein
MPGQGPDPVSFKEFMIITCPGIVIFALQGSIQVNTTPLDTVTVAPLQVMQYSALGLGINE